MLPPNQLDELPDKDALRQAGAVYAYTIPGLKAGDPPIVVTFQREPTVILRDWARDAHAKTAAGASIPAAALILSDVA